MTLSAGTDITFTEDRARRFEAYGWHVQSVADSNDLAAIDAALRTARAETQRPSLILARTHIGFRQARERGIRSQCGALPRRFDQACPGQGLKGRNQRPCGVQQPQWEATGPRAPLDVSSLLKGLPRQRHHAPRREIEKSRAEDGLEGVDRSPKVVVKARICWKIGVGMTAPVA